MDWMRPVISFLCLMLPCDAHPDAPRDATAILQMCRRRLEAYLDIAMVVEMPPADDDWGHVETPVAVKMVLRQLWGEVPPDVYCL